MNPYYNIRPRYTPGSPAMVYDNPTASRVAKSEKAFYEEALTGIMGAELKERAEREGLKGIVERVLRERRENRVNGFVVYDLITCEEYWRPQRMRDDSDAEPDCLYEEDHQIDHMTLHFQTGENNTVLIGAKCKLCGRVGRTQPLGLTFGES
jgi:hypothetical protein